MTKNIFLLLMMLLLFGNGVKAQTSFSATIPYNGGVASGTYTIYRNWNTALTLSQLQRPLILVEGFDPNNEYSSDDIYGMMNQNNLALNLHQAGYDIIVLNFADGGDYIQKNAYLLVELLNRVNAQKPNSHQCVVAGFSMGGLVARYALSYMEKNNINHNTRLYLSYDSPHKGAHIPVSIQALALTFDSPVFASNPDFEKALRQFRAPAAKQMLRFRINDDAHADGELQISADHQAFINEMRGLNGCNGFPSKTRNVAIALGSWNGVGQRSTLDLDNDGVRDFQHMGFPILHINFDRLSTGNVWIGNMNQCDAAAAFMFQSFLSTSYSTKYPNFANRSAYAGLGNSYYATYWYRGGAAGVPKGGAWSRVWYYKGEEPADFAPGAHVASYRQLLIGINSQMRCSYSHANNSSFVSTVSALAFDTEDLFYNIQADPNRLDRTPFDNIIGVTGDNRSHENSVAGDMSIVNFILDEVTGTQGGTCSKSFHNATGTVAAGQTLNAININNIETNALTVNSGGSATLIAGSSVFLKTGTIFSSGSQALIKVTSCSAKTCHWMPSANYYAYSRQGSEETENTLKSFNLISSNTRSMLQLGPNPNSGIFNLSAADAKEYEVYNSQGQLVHQGMMESETQSVDISHIGRGLYMIRVYTESATLETKVVIE